MTDIDTTHTAAAGAQPYIAALRAGDLFADRAYQRDLDATRVERMSGEFDRTLLGVLDSTASPMGGRLLRRRVPRARRCLALHRHCPACATCSAMSLSIRAKASSSDISPAIAWPVRVTSAV